MVKIRPAIDHVIDAAKGKHPITAKRSPHWPAVERGYKKKHPVCEICGYDKHVQVHHKKPFHLHPELELDPDNLISLCEPPGRSFKCHLIFGHVGNWRLFNPRIATDAPYWNDKLKAAKQRRKDRLAA